MVISGMVYYCYTNIISFFRVPVKTILSANYALYVKVQVTVNWCFGSCGYIKIYPPVSSNMACWTLIFGDIFQYAGFLKLGVPYPIKRYEMYYHGITISHDMYILKWLIVVSVIAKHLHSL